MTTSARKARRALLGLLVLLLSIGGLLAYGVYAKDKSWTPGLALDLAGGVEIILKPISTTGDPITQDVLDEAVEVMRKRIDGTGVAEAEITTLGVDNIMVSLPGTPSQESVDLVTEAAQLQFRPVLYADATGLSTDLPSYLDPAQDQYASITDGTASSYEWITGEARTEWAQTDCTVEGAHVVGDIGESDKAFIACPDDSDPLDHTKYLLGPVELYGDDIATANAGPQVNQAGAVVGGYEVRLEFTSQGAGVFEDVTGRLASLSEDNPRNRFAMVLDGEVISAPVAEEKIGGGSARITRGTPPMLADEATGLATKLKYGALPLSFEYQSRNEVQATLGADQLRKGMLAGAIGLLLVVLYSLLQYRALAIVTVGSLVIAAALTMGTIGLMSHLIGYRLSLAGVTGLIVAIGITADSFIVYFERVRDELRDGRSLPSAVEHGWTRARKTIFASDAVSLIAAVALYMTAVGNVRGFAFTLGLTTVIDLIVVIRFTHPVLVLLSSTRFFGGGHRLSGLDPRLFGRGTVYKGRGRVEVGPLTIAQRKAGLTSGEGR